MSLTIFTEPSGTRTDLRHGTRTCMSFSNLGAFMDADASQDMQPTTLRQVAAMTTPAGAVVAFAMPTPPTGWLKCNGQQVSRTTYRALFLAIGTIFGAGDGFNTFNLPDLRGEFIRGWDEGRGVDAGRGFGSWQPDSVGAHRHHVFSNAGSNRPGLTGDNFAKHSGTDGSTDSEYSINGVYSPEPSLGLTSVGGSGTTRPQNIAMQYFIKA